MTRGEIRGDRDKNLFASMLVAYGDCTLARNKAISAVNGRRSPPPPLRLCVVLAQGFRGTTHTARSCDTPYDSQYVDVTSAPKGGTKKWFGGRNAMGNAVTIPCLAEVL